MNRLIIIGASGHGKVVADIAVLNGYKDIVFLDDDLSKTYCGGFPIIGTTDKIVEGDIFVAIGNSTIREKLSMNKKSITLIHPSAVIASDVVIGEGTVVMAGVVINAGVKIGRGCIINTSSSVDHDCTVGDYCHISVGAHLCGTVKVRDCAWIGAGVIISNNVNVCGECMIGAGAVVIKDIDEAGTYVGVPARMTNK